jgi:hypothetical protein
MRDRVSLPPPGNAGVVKRKKRKEKEKMQEIDHKTSRKIDKLIVKYNMTNTYI